MDLGLTLPYLPYLPYLLSTLSDLSISLHNPHISYVLILVHVYSYVLILVYVYCLFLCTYHTNLLYSYYHHLRNGDRYWVLYGWISGFRIQVG
ncbi:hypothetical protein KM540_gp020 [Western grey kangaroopox virus]|uniref:Uncharacterized protein n=1 Tax=Western grey kangaroopox virus TaxID=1566307 RepID=A0A2C9DSG8_9POXV|nr:hypothetical protein KM540_gp020 [Western grey kangaroopox virus]ATI20951.1 hypothetical protein [Western grey kangaroopox virus]